MLESATTGTLGHAARTGRARGEAWIAPSRFGPLLLVAAALLSFVYADRDLPFADEGATLTAAARILRGDVFYRDIDAYPFPGAAYLLAGAMALFGEHLSVARALAGGLFCSWVVALYAVAVRLVGAPRAALFGVTLLGFKLIGWPAFSSYMYSDLAFALGCAALALLFAGGDPPRTARLALAGLCVAGAVAAKQSLGLYLGAACTVLLLPIGVPGRLPVARSMRPFFVFAAAAAIPLGVAAGWFAAHGLLGQLLYSGLVRPFTGYWPTSGISYWPMLAWWQLGSLHGPEAASYLPLDYFHLVMTGHLPGAPSRLWWLLGGLFGRAVYTACVVAVLAWAVRAVRTWLRGATRPASDRLLGFGLCAIAIWLSAFPRADFFHVISVSAPLLLLLIGLASSPGRPLRRPFLALAAVCVFLVLAGAMAAMQRSLLTHRLELERADVRVVAANAWMGAVVAAVEREVPEQAPFFVYGHDAQLYFLTGRFFGWPFVQLYPGQVGEGGGAEIVALLERDPPPVIVRGRQYWPGMPRPSDYAPRLDRWIRRHYVRDPGLFVRHPLPPDAPEPLDTWVSLLRLAEPPASGASPPGSAGRQPAPSPP